MERIEVYPQDMQIGDRILGTNLVVTATAHYKAIVKADGQEYNSEAFYGVGGGYTVEVNGRPLSYGASRKVSVLR